ncbi:Hypothetical predicted protein [Octopus vulgaris]|uniref:Uncharacterized protein n=1 Tax=Octopus vulgaris TaxID=6645 RepID=A0AA36AT14_OCTVU|nr:Hypothetical predicted protein [Octopus vulgaris]
MTEMLWFEDHNTLKEKQRRQYIDSPKSAKNTRSNECNLTVRQHLPLDANSNILKTDDQKRMSNILFVNIGGRFSMARVQRPECLNC